MKNIVKFIPATLALALMAATPALHAQNLVSNGSFEDQGGSFTNWTVTSPDNSLLIDSPSADSDSTHAQAQAFQFVVGGANTVDGGNYYALFTPDGSTASTLATTFGATPGGSYALSFWVNDYYGNNSLTVTADGTPLLTLQSGVNDSGLVGNTGNNDGGWINFEYSIIASGSTVDLSFVGVSGSNLGLDAVNVTATPEPGTLALASLGLVGLVARRIRRNR